MILNLRVTVTHGPGQEPEHVADVNIVVAEPAPPEAARYLLECKDAADATLGRAVADGLTVRHVMDVDEEPDC